MKNIIPFILLLMMAVFVSCSEEKENSDEAQEETEKMSKEEIEDEATKEAYESKVSGYVSLEELSKEVVESIKNKDYTDYVSHVITPEMEETIADEIQDEEKHAYFLGEFGFSLEREEEEFNNMVKYLEERNISLENINYEDMEIIDYHHDDYAPLDIKEVVIIIPHEYEVPLIYTAVKIKDRWFLTSQLEI